MKTADPYIAIEQVSSLGQDLQTNNKPVDTGTLLPRKCKQPRGKSPPLTDIQKEAARARADQAGRRYPDLVDNRWVARHFPRRDDLAVA